MEHTKGKWVAPYRITIWTESGALIGTCSGQKDGKDFTEETNKANALRIVHCVNNFDNLLEVCEKIADIFPENDMAEMDAADFSDRANRIFNAAKQAEQAIAAAKAENH